MKDIRQALIEVMSDRGFREELRDQLVLKILREDRSTILPYAEKTASLCMSFFHEHMAIALADRMVKEVIELEERAEEEPPLAAAGE